MIAFKNQSKGMDRALGGNKMLQFINNYLSLIASIIANAMGRFDEL